MRLRSQRGSASGRRVSIRRPLAAAVAAAALSVAGPATAAPAHSDLPAGGAQELALLRTAHVAYALPSAEARRLRRVRPRRPITGERTALPVLSRARGADGRRWLRVRLPGRPNSDTGWVLRRNATLVWTPWHLVVERGMRRLLVYEAGRRVRDFPAVVGKPSTPTPGGEFFVEESVALPPGAPGGPYALALSARSNVLRHFDGGPGQVAVHGLENIGGIPGTAVSHGCIRVALAAITWLVRRVGPGVPVTIR